MTKVDLNAARAITTGAAFLSCGGGGTLGSSLEMIEKHFPADTSIDLVTVEDAARDASGLTAACTFIGSPTAGTDVTDPSAVIHALDRFTQLTESRTGQKVRRVIALELGVQSSVAPCLCAAQARGMALVDGDGAGRPIMGVNYTTYATHGLSANPGVCANAAGLPVVIEADDPAQFTDVAFGVASAREFGVAGMAIFAMDGPTLERVVEARGTLGLSLEVGHAMQSPDAPFDAVLGVLRGHGSWAEVIFEGVIESLETQATDYARITVAHPESGRKALVLTYGSNALVYRSDLDHPIAMGPDSICWLTADGRTLSNTELPTGTRASLIGIAAASFLRRGALLEGFDLYRRRMGFGGRYVPIEHLHRGR